MSRERPTINSVASDEEAWHVRMRAPGLSATPSCLSRRLGLTRVPWPLLSRLALGKNRRIRATETLPQSVRHYIQLFVWNPFERPVSSLRRMSRERIVFKWLAVQQPSIREEPMPRYKCKSIAALDLALGGLPAEMQVEAEVGTGVSAKTVGELRKVTTWSENLVITTPQERHPESAVKISKASVATRTSPKP
jgi:hypothetical protein